MSERMEVPTKTQVSQDPTAEGIYHNTTQQIVPILGLSSQRFLNVIRDFAVTILR